MGYLQTNPSFLNWSIETRYFYINPKLYSEFKEIVVWFLTTANYTIEHQATLPGDIMDPVMEIVGSGLNYSLVYLWSIRSSCCFYDHIWKFGSCIGSFITNDSLNLYFEAMKKLVKDFIL